MRLSLHGISSTFIVEHFPEHGMNSRQATVLKISVGVLFFTLLYPPYQIMGRSLGYGWIFSPPHEYAIIDHGSCHCCWGQLLAIEGL
jgi:hypothetical protein